MSLTEKGRFALSMIEKYFATETFTAKSLSEICGIKVAPSTLVSLAKAGFLSRFDTSPVTYLFDEAFTKNYAEKASVEKPANGNLHAARKKQNDEFYTRIEDIEAELNNYREYFIGKTVFLNCDDPHKSAFWLYFKQQFQALKLKKLIATHYKKNGQTYKIEYEGAVTENGDIDENSVVKTVLKENGDFRSSECIEILKESDIIVTNPPFSLFREFVELLIRYDKKFLIIGSKNAITYKEIFKLIKQNKLWLGVTNPKKFYIPEDYSAQNVEIDKETGKKIAKFGNIGWFTNLPTKRRSKELNSNARYYNESCKFENYPKYDNYDAIEVSKVVNIPMDYEGVMGVPITFLDKYNPNQFEILGDSRYHDGIDEANDINIVNGKLKYRRILIRNKHPISRG